MIHATNRTALFRPCRDLIGRRPPKPSTLAGDLVVHVFYGGERMIGADELTFAAEGHFERTELYGPKPIHRILIELGVDAEEATALASAMRSHRKYDDERFYGAGWIDGFVIGIRAAREAARRETLS